MQLSDAAWTAAGSPTPPAARESSTLCARCGSPSTLAVATSTVISKSFTAFDDWHDPQSPEVCSACAWCFTCDDLRRHPHLLRSSSLRLHRLDRLDRRSLRLVLRRQLDPGTAVTVPLRPGRKHLLPIATWGRVTTDHGCLAWSSKDAARLAAVVRLRDHGFGSRSLGDPTPTSATLQTLERRHWAEIFIDWEQLEPWREAPMWLDLARYATLHSAEAS